MSGNDIIFPDAVHMLCQIYSTKKANIICSVNYLAENSDGDTVINNKRYSKRLDEQFKTLNTPYLFNSDDLSQKIILTWTRAFNSLIGTKFFKRDFLAKNSIRFNENIATDFELHFIINAIMASNEIMFIPAPFYVAPSN